MTRLRIAIPQTIGCQSDLRVPNDDTKTGAGRRRPGFGDGRHQPGHR